MLGRNMKAAAIAATAAMAMGAVSPAFAGGGQYGRHGGGYHHYKPAKQHHVHHHHYGRHKKKGAKAGVIAGAVIGGVVLGALLNEQRDRRPGYVYPPAYPRQAAGYPQRPYSYAPPAPAYPAPAPRVALDYDSAFSLCLGEARRFMAQRGLPNVTVDSVEYADRLDDGSWSVRADVFATTRGHASARSFECVADADGVRSFSIG